MPSWLSQTICKHHQLLEQSQIGHLQTETQSTYACKQIQKTARNIHIKYWNTFDSVWEKDQIYGEILKLWLTRIQIKCLGKCIDTIICTKVNNGLYSPFKLIGM